MGETVIVFTNGASDANASSDSSTLSSGQDDQPPIAEPPDIVSAIEKPLCPHTLSARRVAELLRTDAEDGLTDVEAAARLARDGPNAIKGAKGMSLWEIFLQQVANALTAVLIAVMALSFAIHDFVEGGVVLAVILLNLIVGYVGLKQEGRRRRKEETKPTAIAIISFISLSFFYFSLKGNHLYASHYFSCLAHTL